MPVQIAITGGKGGTGKSFVAVNLAVLLARHYRLVLADLDAEAPNDHVILGLDKLENKKEVVTFLPFIDTKKCTKCGVCAKICDTGAILMPPGSYPVVFPRLCSGCMACLYACPYHAIIPGGHVMGYSYSTKVSVGGSAFTLITGMLREGEEHTPPVVVKVKRRAEETPHDLLIVDTGAGTGNQITIALKGSKLVIAVTEATPLGLHDLESILKVTSSMGLKTWVVINRYGLGDPTPHLKLIEKYGVEKHYTIPYHRDAIESYVKGVPVVVYKPESPVTSVFNKMASDIMEVIKG
jgi:MinD superfamily P-loop ATPase